EYSGTSPNARPPRREPPAGTGLDFVELTGARVVTSDDDARVPRRHRPPDKRIIMSVRVTALDHLVINVSDVARSAEWYRKVLGMEIAVFDPGNGKPPRTSLMFGDQKINVRPRAAD